MHHWLLYCICIYCTVSHNTYRNNTLFKTKTNDFQNAWKLLSWLDECWWPTLFFSPFFIYRASGTASAGVFPLSCQESTLKVDANAVLSLLSTGRKNPRCEAQTQSKSGKGQAISQQHKLGEIQKTHKPPSQQCQKTEQHHRNIWRSQVQRALSVYFAMFVHL